VSHGLIIQMMSPGLTKKSSLLSIYTSNDESRAHQEEFSVIYLYFKTIFYIKNNKEYTFGTCDYLLWLLKILSYKDPWDKK
jgi:hypothetical protein